MTSEATSPGQAYVWEWLPGAVDPVVAGALAPTGSLLQGEPVLAFRYVINLEVGFAPGVEPSETTYRSPQRWTALRSSTPVSATGM